MIKEFGAELIKIFNSDHPFYLIMKDIPELMLAIWHYPVFTLADKQQILISNIVIGIILFIFGMNLVKKITRVIKKKLSKIIAEAGVVNSLEMLIYYFFMAIMVIFVLDISNVPLAVFTVIGTTLALGIGLGSQNVVNNFISGIIIMIERPIKVGDIIEVKNVNGEVTHIGARCTSIKTSKNINILVPNSSILQDVVINWTLEDTILKSSFNLSLESQINFEEIEYAILDVLRGNQKILSKPEPKIYLVELTKKGYDIQLEFWLDLANNYNSKHIINEINRSFIYIFKKHKIEVADKNVLVTESNNH
ncbi:MAG: mechanosensitive ion channel domain-containing protein [Rickettsiales bacterium]